MAGVYENERANGSVWCYGKGQSILVEKIEKNPKLGKVRTEYHRRERRQRSSCTTHQKQQEEKCGVLLRVQKPQPLGRLG